MPDDHQRTRSSEPIADLDSCGRVCAEPTRRSMSTARTRVVPVATPLSKTGLRGSRCPMDHRFAREEPVGSGASEVIAAMARRKVNPGDAPAGTAQRIECHRIARARRSEHEELPTETQGPS